MQDAGCVHYWAFARLRFCNVAKTLSLPTVPCIKFFLAGRINFSLIPVLAKQSAQKHPCSVLIKSF